MKTELSIPLPMDAIFRKAIVDLSCYAVCIREDVDSNRYEITYNFPHDLFYLGINVGMTSTREIYTNPI